MEYLRILLTIGLLASTGCIVAPRIPTTAVTISAGIGDVANGGDYYAYTIQPQRGVALGTICMPLPTFPVGVTTEGEAFVDFEIDAAGKPKDICVVKSSLVEFGRASVEAIEKWKFQPRRRTFASKAIRVHCEFKFMLSRRPNTGDWCGSGILNEPEMTGEKSETNEPNKALVPTATSVTPAADAPVAPAAAAAHL